MTRTEMIAEMDAAGHAYRNRLGVVEWRLLADCEIGWEYERFQRGAAALEAERQATKAAAERLRAESAAKRAPKSAKPAPKRRARREADRAMMEDMGWYD